MITLVSSYDMFCLKLQNLSKMLGGDFPYSSSTRPALRGNLLSKTYPLGVHLSLTHLGERKFQLQLALGILFPTQRQEEEEWETLGKFTVQGRRLTNRPGTSPTPHQHMTECLSAAAPFTQYTMCAYQEQKITRPIKRQKKKTTHNLKRQCKT